MSIFQPNLIMTSLTYSDCFDQLYEIVQKYSSTHDIIIAGNFNEDISTIINNSRRFLKLRTFMDECNLATNTGPTFVNVNGVDISEIDYFLFNNTKAINVSDHHPITIEIECSIRRKTITNNKLRQSRIRWEKLDKTGYQHRVSINIKEFENNIIEGTISVLVNAAKKNSKQRTYGKNVWKIKIWNRDISNA